jgi:hypothetical protein
MLLTWRNSTFYSQSRVFFYWCLGTEGNTRSKDSPFLSGVCLPTRSQAITAQLTCLVFLSEMVSVVFICFLSWVALRASNCARVTMAPQVKISQQTIDAAGCRDKFPVFCLRWFRQPCPASGSSMLAFSNVSQRFPYRQRSEIVN